MASKRWIKPAILTRFLEKEVYPLQLWDWIYSPKFFEELVWISRTPTTKGIFYHFHLLDIHRQNMFVKYFFQVASNIEKFDWDLHERFPSVIFEKKVILFSRKIKTSKALSQKSLSSSFPKQGTKLIFFIVSSHNNKCFHWASVEQIVAGSFGNEWVPNIKKNHNISMYYVVISAGCSVASRLKTRDLKGKSSTGRQLSIDLN